MKQLQNCGTMYDSNLFTDKAVDSKPNDQEVSCQEGEEAFPVTEPSSVRVAETGEKDQLRDQTVTSPPCAFEKH